ncbi:MAG TPA: ABC transporter ATP-binding protein [Bacteroidales bacterium]|nr:ABC transporter ATP-binding protein [Bacteroidales bacterium]
MEEVIRTDNISKFYRDVKAVSNVSLNVRKGEIYGFLGLNGAGKTTTIRMLLGMIKPTSGTAYINGQKVKANSTNIWKDTGYLVEIPYSYPELTVRENLEIIRRLRFLNDRKSVDTIMEKLSLSRYADRKTKNLSLGNAQRLGLAKALIHQPSILLLDEPANSLDPAGIYEIREMMKDLAYNHGVTLFISSHILGEVSRFASRIGIIHNGRLIQEINSSELEKLCRKRLLINTANNKAATDLMVSRGIRINETPDKMIEISDNHFIDQPDRMAELLVGNNLPLLHLQVTEEDLESYFLRTISQSN